MALPENLITRLQQFYPENFSEILKGFEQERLGSFRINTINASVEEIIDEFAEKKIEISEYTDFSEISGKRFFVYTFDRKFEYAIKGTDAFYQGKIYLQSLASMIPVFALAPKQGQKILDVCAAPGSKTTQIAMMTRNDAKILGLEKNMLRHQKLQHNIKLQGAEESISTHKIDALKFLNHQTAIRPEGKFDAILLDAPCSAEGRISVNREKSYGFWKMKNILEKAQLQFDLLSSSLAYLEKGGVLVYSTCTLAPEENEGVVSRILNEFPEISLETFPEISSEKSYFQKGLSIYGAEISEKTLKILPSQETEGFFVAKFRKS